MAERPVVVLYGDSLFMAGLEASLQQETGLLVKRFARPEAHSGSIRPDVILFDLDAPDSLRIFSCLAEGSGPLLVGLNMTDDRAILFTGHPCTVGTVTDLRRIIESQACN